MGINLGDPVFQGIYHGKQVHEDDFADVLQRAVSAGCKKLMVTGSDLRESQRAIDIAKSHRTYWYCESSPCATVYDLKSIDAFLYLAR